MVTDVSCGYYAGEHQLRRMPCHQRTPLSALFGLRTAGVRHGERRRELCAVRGVRLRKAWKIFPDGAGSEDRLRPCKKRCRCELRRTTAKVSEGRYLCS